MSKNTVLERPLLKQDLVPDFICTVEEGSVASVLLPGSKNEKRKEGSSITIGVQAIMNHSSDPTLSKGGGVDFNYLPRRGDLKN